MKILTASIIILIVYVLQKILYIRMWDKNLESSCRFSKDYIECGESAELKLVVSNAKRLPLPVFQLKFSVDKALDFDDMENAAVTDRYHKSEVFTLMGYQKVTRTIAFTGTRRCVASVDNMSMIVKDFFMSATYAAAVDARDYIYVFPRKFRETEFINFYHGIIGNIETRKSLIEDRMTFRGIREYQSFDGKGSINWKQSARNRSLMVNVKGYTMDSSVKILLNLDTDSMIEVDRLIEVSISIASTFAEQIINRKMAVSLYVNAEDMSGNVIHETGSGADISHLVTIDKTLTEINHSLGKDVFLEKLDDELKGASENIHYLIISSYHKPDMIEKVNRLIASGAGVSMIVPYYDAYPMNKNADYISGWEVSLNA